MHRNFISLSARILVAAAIPTFVLQSTALSNSTSRLAPAKKPTAPSDARGAPDENAASELNTLVQSLVSGETLDNGIEVWFSPKLTDISVSVIENGTPKLLSENLNSTDVLCYRAALTADSAKVDFEVTANTPQGKKTQRYAITIVENKSNKKRCTAAPGVKKTSAETDIDAQTEIVKNLSNGQSKNNGVIFTFQDNISDIEIISVYEGKSSLIATSLDDTLGLCYVFGTPGKRSFTISGEKDGQTLTQNLTLNILPERNADPRCPNSKGRIFNVDAQTNPVTPIRPQPTVKPAPQPTTPPIIPITPKPTPTSQPAVTPTPGPAKETEIVELPIPGELIPNGVPFQFAKGVTNIRIYANQNGKEIQLTSSELNKNGSVQGYCHVFADVGIRSFRVTGTDASGTPVQHTLSYDILEDMNPSSWCPSAPGGLIFDPSIPPKKTTPPPVGPVKEVEIVELPIPGELIPNGVPFQFAKGITNIRIYAKQNGKEVQLTTSELNKNGSVQGYCHVFADVGIRSFRVTGTDASGTPVQHTLSYDILEDMNPISWCPSAPGGAIFDPSIPAKKTATPPAPVPGDTSQRTGNAIAIEAKSRVGSIFSTQQAQCMNFVRDVLAKSCNASFKSSSLNAQNPWDKDLLFKRGVQPLGTGYANSLASDEFGERIYNANDLQPGDLVFKSNTYKGPWPDGVITHVGIYVGNGKYVDKHTFNKGVDMRPVNNGNGQFYGGVRLRSDLCKNVK